MKHKAKDLLSLASVIIGVLLLAGCPALDGTRDYGDDGKGDDRNIKFIRFDDVRLAGKNIEVAFNRYIATELRGEQIAVMLNRKTLPTGRTSGYTLRTAGVKLIIELHELPLSGQNTYTIALGRRAVKSRDGGRFNKGMEITLTTPKSPGVPIMDNALNFDIIELADGNIEISFDKTLESIKREQITVSLNDTALTEGTAYDYTLSN